MSGGGVVAWGIPGLAIVVTEVQKRLGQAPGATVPLVLQSDLAAAIARAEALERDAARYRWLRGTEWGALDQPFIGYRNANGFSQFIGEHADAAIDAAIAAQQAEGE